MVKKLKKNRENYQQNRNFHIVSINTAPARPGNATLHYPPHCRAHILSPPKGGERSQNLQFFSTSNFTRKPGN